MKFEEMVNGIIAVGGKIEGEVTEDFQNMAIFSDGEKRTIVIFYYHQRFNSMSMYYDSGDKELFANSVKAIRNLGVPLNQVDCRCDFPTFFQKKFKTFMREQGIV